MFSFDFGFAKRIYLGPIAVRLDAMAGLCTFQMSTTKEDANGEKDEDSTKLSQNFIDVRTSLALEIVFSTSLNFGVFAGYQLIPGDAVWKKKHGDDVSDNYGVVDDSVDHEGVFGGIMFTYAL